MASFYWTHNVARYSHVLKIMSVKPVHLSFSIKSIKTCTCAIDLVAYRILIDIKLFAANFQF